MEYIFSFTLVDPGGSVVIILASGSEVREFDPGQGRWIFSERKNPEYDFLRKGINAVGPRVVNLWHVKESQAEIRASEQNLSDFSRSNVGSDADDLRC